MLSCGCEPGEILCPTAERLWNAYTAAKDIYLTLLMADEPETPASHHKRRVTDDYRRKALRAYERHIDGGDEPAPEPQSRRVDLRPVS